MIASIVFGFLVKFSHPYHIVLDIGRFLQVLAGHSLSTPALNQIGLWRTGWLKKLQTLYVVEVLELCAVREGESVIIRDAKSYKLTASQFTLSH